MTNVADVLKDIQAVIALIAQLEGLVKPLLPTAEVPASVMPVAMDAKVAVEALCTKLGWK